MSQENKIITPIQKAESLLRDNGVHGVVDLMLNSGYSLYDIRSAMSACGYMTCFSRDEKLKASTLVVSEKPIYYMLADVGRAALDSMRTSLAYPQEVAIADLEESLKYLLANWDEVKTPSCISFTRYEE